MTLPATAFLFFAGSHDHVALPSGVRQLFLDDYLTGALYNVERVIGQPQKYAGNPVLRADRPWEGTIIQIRSAPCWDAETRLWKMWYFANSRALLATSKDGIAWEKPSLGSAKDNFVSVEGDPRAFVQHVVLDPGAPAARRYKGLIGPGDRQPVVSSDGVTFHKLNVPAIASQDESHLNYDEGGRQWIATVKLRGPFGRSVFLSTSPDFERWSSPELIFHADSEDHRNGERRIRELYGNPKMYHPFVNKPDEYNVEIYNMPVFPYESLYIGLPTFFESSGRTPPPHGNQDGINSVKLASSRDLRVWTRAGDRGYFIPISEHGAGQLDSVQVLAASRPIVMGGELWFYYSGIDARYRPDGTYRGAIHLAKLRRDGFLAVHAGREEGFLETRAIRFNGTRLMINADASRGEIRAEVVDERGREVLAGWTAKQSRPVQGDRLAAELAWSGKAGIQELAGKTVRFRFRPRNADLYSFWVE